MDPKGRVALVTGAGHGLGEGLCTRLAANGAAGIIVVDIDSDAAAAVAEKVGGVAVPGDVSQEETLQRAVAVAEATYGRLDVLISNAGVGGGGGPFGSNESWLRVWGVNVMSNVFAARYALPGMLERGEGYLVSTASSNGITTSTSDMSYAATKHAQVAIAEWLAMVYGSRGIRVSCFCPRWMWTEMTKRSVANGVPPWLELAQVDGISAQEAADIVIAGMREERFLITTGADTIRDFRHKAEDFDSWIRQLQDWHDQLQPGVGALPQA
jgi:NAD(P)-dependent dehydrogenase (short-subunit alcohol dehydrogenase family)